MAETIDDMKNQLAEISLEDQVHHPQTLKHKNTKQEADDSRLTGGLSLESVRDICKHCFPEDGEGHMPYIWRTASSHNEI